MDLIIEAKFKNETNILDNQKNLYKFFLQVLVQSYLYEPANFVSPGSEKQLSTKYIHGVLPKDLHVYNHEFARSNFIRSVDCCIDLCYCVGVGNEGHHVLFEEGIYTCVCCRLSVRGTCVFEREEIIETNGVRNTVKKIHCSNCYVEEFYQQEPEIVPVLTDYIPTREEMVRELAAVGSEVRTSDSFSDVQDLYKALIIGKKAVLNGEMLAEQISLPEKESTYLNSIIHIAILEFQKGGQYINNNDLTIKQKIGITVLLAQLVKISLFNANDCRTYRVIPDIIRLFAE